MLCRGPRAPPVGSKGAANGAAIGPTALSPNQHRAGQRALASPAGSCPPPATTLQGAIAPRRGVHDPRESLFTIPERVFTMPGTGVQDGSESVFRMDRRTHHEFIGAAGPRSPAHWLPSTAARSAGP